MSTKTKLPDRDTISVRVFEMEREDAEHIKRLDAVIDAHVKNIGREMMKSFRESGPEWVSGLHLEVPYISAYDVRNKERAPMSHSCRFHGTVRKGLKIELEGVVKLNIAARGEWGAARAATARRAEVLARINGPRAAYRLLARAELMKKH